MENLDDPSDGYVIEFQNIIEDESESDEINEESSWSKIPVREEELPPFPGSFGPKNIAPNICEPIEFFELFYTDYLNEKITNFTNERLLSKGFSFKELVLPEEMKNYVAVLLFNGVLGLKSWKDLFSNSGKLLIEIIVK